MKKSGNFIGVVHNSTNHVRLSIFEWKVTDNFIQVNKVARLKLDWPDGLMFAVTHRSVYLLYKCGNLFKWDFIANPNGKATVLEPKLEIDLSLSNDVTQDVQSIGFNWLLIVKLNVISLYQIWTKKIRPIYSFHYNILACKVIGRSLLILTDNEVIKIEDILQPKIKWQIGIVLNAPPQYVLHDIDQVGEFIFVHTSTTKSKRLFCIHEVNNIPCSPFEISTLGAYQKFLSDGDVVDPYEELFKAQLVYQKTQTGLHVIQFNMGLVFITELIPGSEPSRKYEITPDIIQSIKSLQKIVPKPSLHLADSTRKKVIQRLSILNDLETITPNIVPKSRPELSESFGVSGMRRRIGRVLNMTFIERDEHIANIILGGKSYGQISALYEEVFREEQNCKVIEERRKMRQSQLLNRSRFEMSMAGKEVNETTVEEKIEETSDDSEVNIGLVKRKPRIRLRKSRKKTKQMINQTIDRTMDLSIMAGNLTQETSLNITQEPSLNLETTLNFTQDTPMEETVVEEKTEVKENVKEKIKKKKDKKKKRKSMLGF